MGTNDVLYLVLTGIMLTGVILGAVFVRQEKGNRFDSEAAKVRVKHPASTNPIIWTYFLFPVILFLLAYLIYSMLR